LGAGNRIRNGPNAMSPIRVERTMARKKRKTSRKPKEVSPQDRDTGGNLVRRRRVGYVLACVVSLAFGAAAVMVGSHVVGRSGGVADHAVPHDPSQRLGVLLSAGTDELAGMDIAEMNLLCASGCPGAEEIDIDKLLAKLDGWAERVATETDRNLHRFRENPGKYNNSEAYFRAMMLVTVLQQDLGVRYNPARVRDVDFKRSADLFIHGMIASDNGGTCVSMPVLYASVGRRAGYPLKLVRAKAHVLVRWDSPDGERFNIEATNEGMNSFDDEYYKTWPQKMTPSDIASGVYLKSLTAAEELALFCATRGHCLLDNGRTREAQIAYAQAHHLAPRDPLGLAYLADAVGRERQGIFGRESIVDQMARGRTGSTGRKPQKQRDPLTELRRIEAINAQNRRMMTQRTAPMASQGTGPVRIPSHPHQSTIPQPPGVGMVRPPRMPR
jgi:hypothetical protein